MEEASKAKHYIAVNAGGRYPLLKTAQDYRDRRKFCVIDKV